MSSTQLKGRGTMTKIVLYVSMSLNGFLTGATDGMEHPMALNGHRLHD